MSLPTAPASTAGTPKPNSRRGFFGGWVSAAGLGAATGLVAAYCYYDALLRPLAHIFGLWILLAVVVSGGQTVRRAALRVSTAVFTAIVAFHLGQRLFYHIKYPGDAYAFSLASLALWCLLAVAAGAILGSVFARIGRSDWPGSAAAAAAIGLLAADAYRRGHIDPTAAHVLLTFAVLAIIVILALATASRRQLLRTALLSVLCVVLATALLLTPPARTADKHHPLSRPYMADAQSPKRSVCCGWTGPGFDSRRLGTAKRRDYFTAGVGRTRHRAPR